MNTNDQAVSAPEGQASNDAAFLDGVILALQVLNAGGDMGCAHYEELVNCCGLDALYRRAKAEGMLELSGLDGFSRQARRQACRRARSHA